MSGTAYAALQAVTYWADHQRPRVKATAADRLLGRGAAIKAQARKHGGPLMSHTPITPLEALVCVLPIIVGCAVVFLFIFLWGATKGPKEGA